jgi:hypothetical protein
MLLVGARVWYAAFFKFCFFVVDGKLHVYLIVISSPSPWAPQMKLRNERRQNVVYVFPSSSLEGSMKLPLIMPVCNFKRENFAPCCVAAMRWLWHARGQRGVTPTPGAHKYTNIWTT